MLADFLPTNPVAPADRTLNADVHARDRHKSQRPKPLSTAVTD
jgi:hypothetical protein